MDPERVGGHTLIDVPGFYRSDEKPSRYLYHGPDRVLREVALRDLRPLARWAVAVRELPDLELVHDPVQRRLGVPMIGARLPVVLDRGLRVRTAAPPIRAATGSVWRYDGISSTRAEQLGRVLGCKLRTGAIA